MATAASAVVAARGHAGTVCLVRTAASMEHPSRSGTAATLEGTCSLRLIARPDAARGADGTNARSPFWRRSSRGWPTSGAACGSQLAPRRRSRPTCCRCTRKPTCYRPGPVCHEAARSRFGPRHPTDRQVWQAAGRSRMQPSGPCPFRTPRSGTRRRRRAPASTPLPPPNKRVTAPPRPRMIRRALIARRCARGAAGATRTDGPPCPPLAVTWLPFVPSCATTARPATR